MLVGLNAHWLAILLTAGVILDLLLGEVRRWHPLVGFGRLAAFIEKKFNQGRQKFLSGMLAWIIAVIPITLLSYCFIRLTTDIHSALGLVLQVLLLYFSIGLRSLYEHTACIETALQKGDLELARGLTSRIVSRDTDQAEESDLAKAGVESLLENGNDAVFGTLFWFAVAGGPGAVMFRLANTLDAMWGYRTDRFASFGCAAARIDDMLNWIPARLTALSYAFLGNTRLAWECWRRQAPQWSSPNAGPVMASGAGALELELGGAAVYEGKLEDRPLLGSGHAAQASDIGRAWRLVWRTTALWVGAATFCALLVWLSGGTHA